jgi:hypothetical protein
MRFSTVATAMAATSLASARIVGIAAPPTLAPNSTFTLTLVTENYIQTVADVAVAWGFQFPTAAYPNGFPNTLGSFAGSAYLGPSKSNTLGNVTVQAVAPVGEAWEGKTAVLSVGLFSLYGASGSTVVGAFNVTVDIEGK